MNGATGSNSDGITPCIVYRYPAALHASSVNNRNELYRSRTFSNTPSDNFDTLSNSNPSFPSNSLTTSDRIDSPNSACDSTRDDTNVRLRSVMSSATLFPRKRPRRLSPFSFSDRSSLFADSVPNRMLFA